ncbi:hypothetical protein CVT26_012354 [Gymnopilus dilepis]|uniref:DUF6534 domain-containing protein n=1 Tax=Gymnopilus dilepis TaxID=231916 RepID=A0A409X0I7_9AGAR|nr:hypothetical protein CVT26_012354 [Gymnopilus dilepis]
MTTTQGARGFTTYSDDTRHPNFKSLFSDTMDASPSQSYAESLSHATLGDRRLLQLGPSGSSRLANAYYIAFPKDRTMAKTIVYTIFILEVVQTGIVSHDIYASLASSFGDITAVDAIRTNWLSIPVSGGTSGFIGQIFFSYRIWMMTEKQSRGAPLIIGILALASWVSALVCAEAFFRAKNFSVLLGGDSSFASIAVWNGFGAICDITIALSMPYFLMRHGTGTPATHAKIVRVVRLIIETGGLTAIFAILHLCLYFANNQSFIVPGLSVSKLYANTMLVILNNRMRIVDGRTHNPNDSDPGIESPRRLFAHPESRRSTSTVVIKNGRLVFRLNDLEKTMSRNAPSHTESIGDIPGSPSMAPVAVKINEEHTVHFDEIPPASIAV